MGKDEAADRHPACGTVLAQESYCVLKGVTVFCNCSSMEAGPATALTSSAIQTSLESEIFDNFSRWGVFETHLGKQIFVNSHFMMNIHVLYRGVSDWDLTCMHVPGQICYHRQLQEFKARHDENKE